MDDQSEQLRKAVLAIKKLQSTLQVYQAKEKEQVAILGMACRLPGKSNDLTSYWNLLTKGDYCISKMPDDRWDTKKYFDESAGAPGKYNSLLGCFVDDVKGFDHSFFDISEEEASAMDPHQRMIVTVMWEALQNAYIPPSEIIGKNVGVFLGMGSDKCDYMVKFAEQLEKVGVHTGVGITLNGASGRISYILNSQGPSETVDTACCSSLVALHHAQQSLLLHECDIAVVGGVSLILSPLVNVICTKMGVLSTDGHTRGFDRDASGFGRGEGCGVLILKRLSDAKKNLDKVLAIVRGSAFNHNGMTMSLTAPSQLAQEVLFKKALSNARLEANDVTHIEANATASKLGDSLELDAIKKVYGENRTRDCYLASANTHFGHMDAATGVAGLIKTVLLFNYKKITRMLDFKSWNGNVNFSDTKFHVPTELMDWKMEEGKSRIGAVSVFGWSGQNAHVILEESPQEENSESGPYLLPVSAKSAPYLMELLELYEKYLSENGQLIGVISKLASNGRDHYKFRRAFLGKDAGEIIEQIKKEKGALAEMPKSPQKLVFQFPDIDYPSIKALSSDDIVKKIKEKAGVDLLAPGGDSKTQMFRNFAVRYLLAMQWTSWLGKPHEICSSQTSESGEMAYFNEKTIDEMIDDLIVKGKLAYPAKDKIGGIKGVSTPSNDMYLIKMSAENIDNEGFKLILRDLYNGGRKINWSKVYPDRWYQGILELPKHPFHPKPFWF